MEEQQNNERSSRQEIGRVLTIVLKVILVIIALQLLLPTLAAVVGVLTALFGLTIGGMVLVPAFGYELLGGSTAWTWVLCVSLALAGLMPLYMLLHWLVQWIREHKHPGLRFWLITLLIWFLSLCGLAASVGKVLLVNGTDWISMLRVMEEWDEDEEAMVTESRMLEPFDAINLSGAVKADIRVGLPQEVTVRYDRADGIETEVQDGTLMVSGNGDHSGRLSISVPSLHALALSGAGKVELSGATDSLRLDVSGAGKVDADKLTVTHLHANISGAAKAEVFVTGTLRAQASGAGKLEYKGNPQVLQSLSIGAGSIKRD